MPSRYQRRRIQRYFGRAAALGATLLFLASGCGDDDSDDSADSQDETAPAASAPEPEPTTTTAFVPDGPEEWVEVVVDIHERHFELLQSPDPDRLDEVYARECDCWGDLHGTLEFLAERDEHIDGAPVETQFVKHENTTEELGLVDLTVRGRQGDVRRVDAAGEVVEEIEGGDWGCTSLTIRQDGPDDSWRIYTQFALTGCPEGP